VRNTILLAASQAAFLTVGQAVFILAALVTFALSGSAAMAGLASGLVWGGRVLIVYHSGKLMDKVGRRLVLMLGAVVSGVGALILAVAVARASLIEFLLGLLVAGFGSGMTQQARVAVADMYPATRRGEGVGYLMTGNVIGAILSSVFTATMIGLSAVAGIDVNLLILIAGAAILFASTLLVWGVSPEPKDIARNLNNYFPDGEPTKQANNGSMGLPIAAILLAAPMMAAFLASSLAQGDMSMMMSLVSLVLNQHDVPLTLISLAVSAHIVGMFALSLPFGKLSDRMGRKWTISLGGAVLAAGAFLTPATGHYEIITGAIVLVGVGWSAINVASTAMISDLSSANVRGRILGLNDMTIALTAISLPVMGGLVISTFGFQAFAVLGLLFAVPIILAVVPLNESRPGKFGVSLRSPES
jgi:MFS family permease